MGVTREYMLKCFTRIFFVELKNSEREPKMITCVKGGPRRIVFGKVCGAEEFLCCCYNDLKYYLARSLVEKDVLGTGPNPPPPPPLLSLSAICTR